MKGKHLLGFVAYLLGTTAALAADDPFSAAEDKTEAITEGLTGPLAVAVTTLVVVVLGYMMLSNRLQKETAIRSIIGTIIIGSAASIAGFLFG